MLIFFPKKILLTNLCSPNFFSLNFSFFSILQFPASCIPEVANVATNLLLKNKSAVNPQQSPEAHVNWTV